MLSRHEARAQLKRGGINLEFESALRNFLPRDNPDPIPGMSQLIDPEGERGAIVTTAFAQYWIDMYPEWKREDL